MFRMGSKRQKCLFKRRFQYDKKKINQRNYLNFYFKLDDWRLHENQFEKLDFGKWGLKIPALADGSCAIKNGSILKVYQLNIEFHSNHS